jgi:hypothetical protein
MHASHPVLSTILDLPSPSIPLPRPRVCVSYPSVSLVAIPSWPRYRVRPAVRVPTAQLTRLFLSHVHQALTVLAVPAKSQFHVQLARTVPQGDRLQCSAPEAISVAQLISRHLFLVQQALIVLVVPLNRLHVP